MEFTIPGFDKFYGREDFFNGNFTNLKGSQSTQSSEPEKRHILDVDVHILVLSLAGIRLSEAAKKIQKNILSDARINKHQHDSHHSNVSGESSDKEAQRAIYESFKTGRAITLKSNPAGHIAKQADVILRLADTFDNKVDYKMYIHTYVKITEKLFGPTDSQKFSPNPIVDKRKFKGVLQAADAKEIERKVNDRLKAIKTNMLSATEAAAKKKQEAEEEGKTFKAYHRFFNEWQRLAETEEAGRRREAEVAARRRGAEAMHNQILFMLQFGNGFMIPFQMEREGNISHCRFNIPFQNDRRFNGNTSGTRSTSSWDTFRKEHKNMGMTIPEMSKAYQKSKK